MLQGKLATQAYRNIAVLIGCFIWQIGVYGEWLLHHSVSAYIE